MSSIVVNRAGEWKLTGFEYSHSIDDQQTPFKVLHNLDVYDAPEKSPISNMNSPQNNRNSLPTESGIDSWGLGCLIWEIFNSVLINKKNLQNPGLNMPKRILSAYQGLLNAQATKRLNAAKFLTLCRQDNGFMNNHFVDTLLFLEQIQIKDQAEKTKFFSELTQKLDDFPSQLCIFKILPQLLHAYEYGNAGSSVLAPLFKLGKLLDESEYQKKIIPVVVKLFSSTDRTTRMRLLQQLELFVEHLNATIINDQIFPHICQGFSDTNPAIRESTIRSIVLLAPKLNYNNMNVELMKHFARLQGTDDQGMIRTNTTVCIGKIAPYINPQLRQRILLSAFPKAMRDPFPLARLSGVIALANTDRFYTLRDISSKVLPSLCTLCIDPEKDVRDEAFKTIKIFLSKLEKVSETPELALEYEKDVTSCDLNLKNETSWTSWAMTSLSNKMSGYKNKTQGPSVALNTQPLGPPPSLTPSSPSNASPNASASSSNINNKQKSPASKEMKDNTSPSISSGISENKRKDENKSNAGWAVDEEEWKDLDDDDDQMEPLESIEPKPNYNLSTKKLDDANKSNKQQNDWSTWTNSFDDNQFNNNNNHNTNNNNSSDQFDDVFGSKSQFPSASSYNWSNQNKFQNEEELFNNLVKDVKVLTIFRIYVP
jgi:SCY1-like protein 1